MQVAVVLCPYLLTTERSFDSPTASPHVPSLYARAYSVRIVSSAFRQASMLSKKRFVSTGWEPKTKTKSINFIAFLQVKAGRGFPKHTLDRLPLMKHGTIGITPRSMRQLDRHSPPQTSP